MRGIQADSEAAQVLQDQLQEIKDRWNHVNEQVVELRLVTLAVMTSEVVYIRLFNSCRRLICNQWLFRYAACLAASAAAVFFSYRLNR